MEHLKEYEQIKEHTTTLLKRILELENKIKKKNEEKHDLMKDFFLSVIDIIDSFDNKYNSLLKRNIDNEQTTQTINSFSILRKMLLNVLGKYGVTKIFFPENKLIFGFVKVIDTEPDPNKDNETIISIIRDGYIRGKEVIREAEIIVVKN